MLYLRSYLLCWCVIVLAGNDLYCQTQRQTAGDAINIHSLGLIIIIDPVFDGKPLQLDTMAYTNDHGGIVYLSTFKFYITNIALSSGEGDHKIRKTAFSHLFDAEDISTAVFSVNVPFDPGKNYDKISFTLGVDSIDNTNGANAGDLDPSIGMYWAWNTGYIMANVEGTSKACHTLHNAFEFHIGGYMPPYSTDRKIVLQFPQPIHFTAGQTEIIKIKADVAAWFSGALDLSRMNSILIPGKEASEMADRYTKMFTLEEVAP